MNKLFPRSIIIFSCAFGISCQSDTDKANEVLSYAIKMQEAQAAANAPAPDSVKLDIQTSAFTEPVKVVPTQEELIKKHRVKTMKQIYTDGWYMATYDKKGNKTGEESDYSGKKKFHCELDKNGNLLKEKITWKDGSVTTRTNKYNEEGKLVSKTYTDSDGKNTVTTFEYNPALNTRTEISENGTDKEFYDNRGLRVRFESYDEKGKLIGSGTAEYNKDGLKISETSSILGLGTNDTFEYNEAGQLTRQHRTGMVDVYFLFEYNDKGLISTSKNVKGFNEEETKYEYTFY